MLIVRRFSKHWKPLAPLFPMLGKTRACLSQGLGKTLMPVSKALKTPVFALVFRLAGSGGKPAAAGRAPGAGNCAVRVGLAGLKTPPPKSLRGWVRVGFAGLEAPPTTGLFGLMFWL
jgi:hypothetical protein